MTTQARMADVAREAGVSLQTVSRAFNPGSVIRETTRAEVLAVAGRLGYRRNLAARALATRRTGLIGLIASATSEFGPARTVLAITEAAQQAGFAVVLTTLPDTDPATVAQAVDRLAEQRVEAILVVNQHRTAHHAALRHRDPVPVITVGATIARVPGVEIDQHLGGRLAVDHLLDRGHTAIGLLAGPADWLDARRRLAGSRHALRRRGLSEVAMLHGDWTAEAGHRLGLDLLRNHTMTAVAVANDQMAVGLLAAARELGRNVPDDLAVIGCDNRPETAFYSPALTTVDQDFDSLGATAVELLATDATPDTPRRLHPTLVVRAST